MFRQFEGASSGVFEAIRRLLREPENSPKAMQLIQQTTLTTVFNRKKIPCAHKAWCCARGLCANLVRWGCARGLCAQGCAYLCAQRRMVVRGGCAQGCAQWCAKLVRTADAKPCAASNGTRVWPCSIQHFSSGTRLGALCEFFFIEFFPLNTVTK